MESSHGRNVGTARLCNDCVFTTKNPAQLQNSKVRNSIDGFPCVLYINDELQGIYNFNADRYSNNVFGYTDPDNHLVYEISANSDSTAGAFFKYTKGNIKFEVGGIDHTNGQDTSDTARARSDYINISSLSGTSVSWSSNDYKVTARYYDKDKSYLTNATGSWKSSDTWNIPSNVYYMRFVVQDINDENAAPSLNGAILFGSTVYAGGTNISELDYYKSDFICIYPPTRAAGNDNFNEIKRLVEWVDGASDEDFRDNLEQYFNKEYLIRYFIIVHIFALVDSLGKNMKIASFDGGNTWYPQVYDMDTSCGLDNSGFLLFDSDVEIGDKISGRNVFNTTSSNLWQKVMILLMDDIKAEYAKLRNTTLTLNNIIKYIVEDQIEMIPSTFYNHDMQTKYLNFGTTYLYALHGNSKNQLIKFITDRLLYMDTLYDYTVTTTDFVTLRSSKKGLNYLDIQTFIPMYLRIKWRNEADGSGIQKLRVGTGETVRFSYEISAEGDQEVLIYGGKYLKSIGDVSNLEPSTISIGNAPRLTDLTCHSENLINTDLANCVNLTHVDLSGCTNLGTGVGSNPVLDISKCMNLQYIDIRNTTLTSVQLNPLGTNIEQIWYPTTVESIVIQNSPNLTIVGLTYGHSCKELKLINCPNVEAFGEREYNSTTDKYKYANGYFLSGVKDVYFDNSLLKLKYFDITYCKNLQNVTLKNMPNLIAIYIGINTLDGLILESYNYSTIDPVYSLDNSLNAISLKFEIFNCNNIKDFYITCAARKSSVDNTLYGLDNSKLLLNTLDLSKLNIENLYIYNNVEIYKLLLPVTLKNFIRHPYMDHDGSTNYKNSYGQSHYWSDERIYEKLFSTDYVSGIFGNQESSGAHVIAKSGGFIHNIYVPSVKDESYIVAVESPFIWDFEGIEFDEFYNYGDNMVVYPGYQSRPSYKFTYSTNKIDIKNLNCKPKKYLTPFNTTWINSVQGVIDLSEYNGVCVSYGLAYLTDNVRITPLLYYDNIKYWDYFIYYTNLTQITWNDEIISKYFSALTGSKLSTQFRNITLKEQLETDEFPSFTNEVYNSDSSNMRLFRGCNLKYINELNLLNLTGARWMMNNNGESEKNHSIIERINKLYLPKCSSLGDMFPQHKYIKNIGIIKVDIPVTSMQNIFTWCGNFEGVDEFDFILENANIQSAFYHTEKYNKEIKLKGSVSDISSVFGSCTTPSIDLSELDMSNVTSSCYQSFANINIDTLDLTSLSQGSPTNFFSFLENSKIKNLIGLEYIPDSVTACNAMMKNLSLTNGIIPKFRSTSSCTTTSTMFQNIITDIQPPSSYYIPPSVTDITNMFDNYPAMPTDFIFDCSKVDALLKIGNTFINVKGLENFTFKLPKYIYVNNVGTINVNMMNRFIANVNTLKSVTFDWTSFKGSSIGAQGFFFNNNIPSLILNGIAWDKFGYQYIDSHYAKIEISDFSVYEPASNTNIDLAYMRLSKEITARFIDEALGSLDCANLIGSTIYKDEYSAYSACSVQMNRIKFPNTGNISDDTNIKIILKINKSNAGSYANIYQYSDKNTTNVGIKTILSQNGTDDGTYITYSIYLKKLITYPYISLGLQSKGLGVNIGGTSGWETVKQSIINDIINDEISLKLESPTQTSKTLTLSKYTNYPNTSSYTEDDKIELSLQASPKGWNLAFV